MSEHTQPLKLKPFQIFTWAVVIIAFAGFFIGTRPRPEQKHADHPVKPSVGKVDPARSYGQLQRAPFTANDAHQQTITKLAANRPRITPPAREPGRLAETLAARAKRRAFAGAPPTVPHPVSQRGKVDCAACHTSGLKVGAHTAPAMSHKYLENCTQCHVPERSPAPGAQLAFTVLSVHNSFVGAREPRAGERAYRGAPPTMPHQTLMRTECASCHGVLGDPGMRTTHPWRTNCVQCHALSSALDFRPATLPWKP